MAFSFTKTTTSQKMVFSIKDFFSKCDQIRCKLPKWLHLLKKSLTENFIFGEVTIDLKHHRNRTSNINLRMLITVK